MSFKRFLIWSSGSPFVWCSKTIYAILKDGIMGNISRPKPFVQLLQNISRGTILRNYFEFGHVVQQEMPFKGISFWISGCPFVQRSATICAILVKGIMRNNYVKLF